MPVIVNIEASVATVTMDWPDTRNALTSEQIPQVVDALHAAAQGANAVVLTGAGAFCAGANLKALARKPPTVDERRHEIEAVAQSLVSAIIAAPVPVFAAVDGPAIGFGFDVALACDQRFIGPDGWCMQGWGRVGVIAGTGGELLLRRLNPTALWELLAHQPRLDGAGAERLGLGVATAPAPAQEAARACAEHLAALPPETSRAYVELHRAELRAALPAHLTACARIQAELLDDPELAERIAALLAKTRGSGRPR